MTREAIATARAAESHGESQRDYYERRHHPNVEPRAETPYLRRHIAESLRVARLQPGERVLEIGCGAGKYTALLATRGIAVEGLDVSSALLDRLDAYAGAQGLSIPLHCADVQSPPSDLQGRFHAVLGYFVLHHVDDLAGCFRSVARLLEPGGRAVFIEPNPLNALYYAQLALTPSMTWAGERGMLRMTARAMLPAIEAAGLAARPIERFGFFPPFLANRAAIGRFERPLEAVRPWARFLPFQIFAARRSAESAPGQGNET